MKLRELEARQLKLAQIDSEKGSESTANLHVQKLKNRLNVNSSDLTQKRHHLNVSVNFTQLLHNRIKR